MLQIKPILTLQDGRVQAAGATDQAVDLAAALGARLGVDNLPVYTSSHCRARWIRCDRRKLFYLRRTFHAHYE